MVPDRVKEDMKWKSEEALNVLRKYEYEASHMNYEGPENYQTETTRQHNKVEYCSVEYDYNRVERNETESEYQVFSYKHKKFGNVYTFN